MGPGATTDAARGERASMTTGSEQHISIEDGVFVHDCIVFQDSRGSWWAYRGGSVMFSTDRDDLLQQIARATDSSPDLDDLIGRLNRSIGRAGRRHAEAVKRG